MRHSVNVNANLLSLRIGSLVLYGGKYYLRGRFSRSCGIQLVRFDCGCYCIMYVPKDTIVHHFKGFPDSLAGFGLNA